MAKLLIIEDEAPIRANLGQLLRLEGHTVSAAENGKTGIAEARASPPDLILCDILMPEMDGYAVLAALRATPGIATTPFIFLTASANREERAQALKRGASDYLVKPFKIEEVLNAIERALHKKSRGET